jgi:hypothetical protein
MNTIMAIPTANTLKTAKIIIATAKSAHPL